MIAVIDYGAGNLSSVTKAFSRLAAPSVITSDPEVVRSAQTLVLPGVGAAGVAMQRLDALGLSSAIRNAVSRHVPFLGICLGMQLLLGFSEEHRGSPCLGIIPGMVRRLPAGQKIPHMGWNQVCRRMEHPLFKGIPDNSDFYFVHSFFPDPENKGVIAGTTIYGIEFCSIIASGNIIATQFHPEKSGEQGLKLLDNFLTFAMVERSST